jgi:hypothetical protein
MTVHDVRGFGEVFYANSYSERRSSRSDLSSRPQATSIEATGPLSVEAAITAGPVWDDTAEKEK